jgi:hypothetical protein
MIKNFASAVVEKEEGDAWVSRFLQRQRGHLTSKWTTGIDRNRYKADSQANYSLYFDILHSKIREYNVESQNVYNMDGKRLPHWHHVAVNVVKQKIM